MTTTSNLTKKIFSFEGFSIAVGVIGVLGGLASFIWDVDAKISVGWFLAFSWVAITFIFVLIRTLYLAQQDLTFIHSEYKKLDQENIKLQRESGGDFLEKPIRYIPDKSILIIKKNDHFINQILVAVYHSANDDESLACLGRVLHIQDKFIQIKLLDYEFPDRTGLKSEIDLNSYLVRPVIPHYALEQIFENR